MDIHQFHDELRHLSSAKTLDEITTICQRYASDLGFDNFIYALRIPSQFSESQIVLVKGFPDEWLNHYFESAFYECDPVIKYCNNAIVPVAWHNLRVAETSTAARVMHEATEFGLKTGISMPIHTAQGEFGIFSFSINSQLLSAQLVAQQAMLYVQLMAGYVHEAIRRVLNLHNKPVGLLTEREKECLRWAADGKTSWEIAQLLHVTERTANFHLNNVMLKLDVSNRQHAIAKAVLQGFISPQPF
jgi:DNA-binding CsgD family transcriptional regulator